MFIQTYMIVITCIIFVTTMFGTYTIFKRLQSLQSAMDDLGKSRAISYDAIARLDELESTINTIAEGLEEIDGGVTNQNAKQLIECGAHALVAGSFVFSSENPKESILELKNIK